MFVWMKLTTRIVSVSHPARKGKVRYRDYNDKGHKDSSWNDLDMGPMTEDDICPYPLEHRGTVVDPETIVAISKRLEANNPDFVPIRFYAFFQPEGTFVVTKQHNVHAVISIGQSFSVAHNFLEPQHIMHMYNDGGEVPDDGKPINGAPKCRCPFGETNDEEAKGELGLRPMGVGVFAAESDLEDEGVEEEEHGMVEGGGPGGGSQIGSGGDGQGEDSASESASASESDSE